MEIHVNLRRVMEEEGMDMSEFRGRNCRILFDEDAYQSEYPIYIICDRFDNDQDPAAFDGYRYMVEYEMVVRLYSHPMFGGSYIEETREGAQHRLYLRLHTMIRNELERRREGETFFDCSVSGGAGATQGYGIMHYVNMFFY